MITAIPTKLSLRAFEEQYGLEKPYFEFWYGEPVQKATPTWIHALLQKILMELLSEQGFKSGSEVKLRLDPEFQPVPDIVATRGRIELPYPTKPLEVVIEILSDEDPMSRVLSKCRTYATWGFEEIYVVDPGARLVFRWREHRLEETATPAAILAGRIWLALDRELE